MTAASQTDPVNALLIKSEVEDFFSLEAELLDERRFNEWLDLLHEDLWYWMPIARNVRFDQPRRNIPAAQRSELVRRRQGHPAQAGPADSGGDHWAEEPRSRTTHLVCQCVASVEGADISASAALWCTLTGSSMTPNSLRASVDVLRRRTDN